MTFSIIGHDPSQPAWGIAISSRFIAVGAGTRHGAGDAGVVVLQANLNSELGPLGVRLLRDGRTADEAIERMLVDDPYRSVRQVAAIDSRGGVSTFTGEDCGDWAGGRAGPHSAAQGNMLLNGRGVDAMVEQFESSKGPLARRLVDALATGDREGGDARGRQAAALLIVRPSEERRFDVFTEPVVDLRVDDHENPFAELSRLLDIHELVYNATAPEDRIPADGDNVRRLQTALGQRGYLKGPISGTLDEATRDALARLAYHESFKRRLPSDEWIDGRLLRHLEAR